MSDEDDAREQARAVIYDELVKAAREALANGVSGDELIRHVDDRIAALRSPDDRPSSIFEAEDGADDGDRPS